MSCGAFHVAGLREGPVMTEEEERTLPRTDSASTLMPYSYYRLSTRSGYGAGNKAPAYFELLWEERNRGDSRRLGRTVPGQPGCRAPEGGKSGFLCRGD